MSNDADPRSVIPIRPVEGGRIAYILHRVGERVASVVDLTVNTAVQVDAYLTERRQRLRYLLHTYAIDEVDGERAAPFTQLIKGLGLFRSPSPRR